MTLKQNNKCLISTGTIDQVPPDHFHKYRLCTLAFFLYLRPELMLL